MHSSGAGPAEGAAVLFAVATCLIAAWSGTLLGTIFGWIGVRRSSSGKRFARAIAIVNTTVALLPAVPVLLWLIALLCSLVGLTR
jgi:ABC-type sulfate transport system permease component